MRRTRGRPSLKPGGPSIRDEGGIEGSTWSGWRPHEFHAPVETFRSSLYTGRELYSPAPGLGAASTWTTDLPYADTLDARAYAWSRVATDRDSTLAQALHDHAIDEALESWVAGRHLVGVMGGHALRRGEPAYAAAARIGHRLGASYTVATGGGPGAMEAANLGAFLADEDDLGDALDRLARVPDFTPVGPWAAAAFDVVSDAVDGPSSLGIPTWHYGHEPPNVFATAIAKYFKNAVREAILLQICDAGIVFLPGAAGTVQEVFQDACENYYADESLVAPMVLVGRQHWTETVPAWPLLTQLARGRAMADHIHLVDTADEAADLLAGRVLGEVPDPAT